MTKIKKPSLTKQIVITSTMLGIVLSPMIEKGIEQYFTKYTPQIHEELSFQELEDLKYSADLIMNTTSSKNIYTPPSPYPEERPIYIAKK